MQDLTLLIQMLYLLSHRKWGSGTPSLADVKVTMAANTTLSESEAATSNNITKVDLAKM